MEKIFFSIIINNYNYGRYLRDAIDSALNQTYPYREIIVVDDGSTDDSREIIHSYGAQILAVLKDNGGQASALNAGWNVCRGNMIIFLDSDDMLLPYALDVIVKQYDLVNKMNISKIQYFLQAISAEGKRLGYCIPEAHPKPGTALDLLLNEHHYPSPPTSGNVFPRDVVRAIFPVPEKEYSQGADYYLLQQAPFLGEIVSINQSLGYYRIHGHNRSLVRTSGDRLRRDEKNERILIKIASSYGFYLASPEGTWQHMKTLMMKYKLGLSMPAPGYNVFCIAFAGIN